MGNAPVVLVALEDDETVEDLTEHLVDPVAPPVVLLEPPVHRPHHHDHNLHMHNNLQPSHPQIMTAQHCHHLPPSQSTARFWQLFLDTATAHSSKQLARFSGPT